MTAFPCQVDPALFDDENRQREARRACHTCPDLTDCRTRVLAAEAEGNGVYGVAGGMLPADRPHAPRMVRGKAADGEGEQRQARVLKPCGTEAAKRRHRERGEKCAICYLRDRDDGLKPHGTTAAARRHERAREPLCDPCRLARTDDARRRREQNAQPDMLAVGIVLEGERDMPLSRKERRLVITELYRRGLSGEQIAQATGTTRRTVVRVRNDQRNGAA